MTTLSKQIVLGILLGIAPTAWILQNNDRVKNIFLQPVLQELAKKWHAEVTITGSHVNIFTGTVLLDNFNIRSLHTPGCNWLAKQCVIQIQGQSILQGGGLLSGKQIIIAAHLKDNHIVTDNAQGTLGISLLVDAIFKNQPKLFNTKSFTISNCTLTAPHMQQKPSLQLEGPLKLKKDNAGLWSGRLCFENGTVKLADKTIVAHLQGTTSFSEKDANFVNNLSFQTLIGGMCAVRARWDKLGKSIRLKNNNDTILFSMQPTSNGSTIHAHVSVQELWPWITLLSNLDLTAKLHQNKCGTYTLKGFSIPLTGNICAKEPFITLSGTCVSHNYVIQYDRNTSNAKLIITKHGKTLAKLCRKQGIISGNIQYAMLKPYIPMSIKRWLLGNNGLINIKITDMSKERISGELSLKDGAFHIPGHYNLIKTISSTFHIDIAQKTLTLQNTTLGMHKGSIHAKRAVLYLNKDHQIDFLHASLTAKDVLLNWKNDFFGFIDGNMFIHKKHNTPLHLTGDLIVKKSLLRDNMFSQDDAGPYPDVILDINLSNAHALTIHTGFFKATGNANIHIKTNPDSKNHHLSGRAVINRGSLEFPRNKLFISSGKIDFIPSQINNPMLNILAKNRIKKYMITLHIMGQMQKPTIFLESNPSLTEEQIVSLLFAGSESVPLHSNIPSLVMQNLSTFILGSKKLSSHTSNFFQNITKPLKYVQISPNFTDQSGRGGIKGTISIDINKQLHANIQKNFTMQDDLTFELEYFLSDACHMKAIKDHRGDLGAEVEFIIKK